MMSMTWTRRRFTTAALALGACRSGAARQEQRATGASAGAPAAALDFGGLEVKTVSAMSDAERGGTAVTLLHGFGARGDDLVPLARRLLRPRARFFVPAAPLPQGADGRAWWYFSEQERPAQVWDGHAPPGYRAHAQVLRVRRAVQTLLASVRQHYVPERLVLAGFSQGGMLTLDVALAGEPAVDRAAVLSGALIAESVDALRRTRTSRPVFLMSHGRDDRVLPFQGAEAARATLSEAGFSVEFEAFEGGHQIPPEVVAHLTQFIFG